VTLIQYKGRNFYWYSAENHCFK